MLPLEAKGVGLAALSRRPLPPPPPVGTRPLVGTRRWVRFERGATVAAQQPGLDQGRRATLSISISAPLAKPLTPTQVRAGNRLGRH